MKRDPIQARVLATKLIPNVEMCIRDRYTPEKSLTDSQNTAKLTIKQ